MAQILIISIGPVQDFIAAARKTRDLFAGSEMLCEVSRTVADFLQTHNAKLIFPDGNTFDSKIKQPIANKILCIVKDDTAHDLADESEKVAQSCILQYIDKLQEVLNNNQITDNIDIDLIRRQCSNFLEFYSAWNPLKDDYSDYVNARNEVELLLAGRKMLRDFATADGKPNTPKSALDPGRESIFDPKKIIKQPGRLGIKKGEQLDGISLIKRLVDPIRFVSTARVTADPFIRHLKDDDLECLIKCAKELIRTDLVSELKVNKLKQYKKFPYDTQLFFGEPSSAECEELTATQRDNAKKFFNIVKAHGSPQPYFAVLAADGDYMGDLIDSIRDPKEHQTFSRKLVDFNNRVENIINTHQGALVYSGGDDILAFLPLDTALDCIDELRIEFAKILPSFQSTSNPPSLSCGLAICHYSDHMHFILEWARNAEKAAKKEKNKNSLALHLHTRTAGVEFISSVNSWDDDPVQSRWLKVIVGLYNEAIPTGVAYELRRLVSELAGTDTGNKPNIWRAEVKRILNRKQGQQGKVEIDKELVDEIMVIIGHTLDDLQKFVNELIIARHFVKAYKTADKQPSCGGVK